MTRRRSSWRRAVTSPRARSGIRWSIFSCSRTCPETCAGAGTPRGGVAEVSRPANKCNGMTYDADLNLIVCEHATSSLVRERPDGTREVLATISRARSSTAPTTSACAPTARSISPIPIMGACRALASSGRASSASRAFIACRLAAAGRNFSSTAMLFDQPNGLCFSPDEKLLYVNDTEQTLIRVFDVAADGSLSERTHLRQRHPLVAGAGVPDGMKCDERGNVWVTGPGGVWVYAPSGDLIGKVRIPEEVANLAWGGPEFRTLFLTATHSVYRVDDQGRAAASSPTCDAHRGRPRSGDWAVAAVAARWARSSTRARCRADHSGHAERRRSARAAPSRVRRAGARARAERGREHRAVSRRRRARAALR